MNKKWIALFSHTGSEIVNISNRLDRIPDKIITNQPPGGDIIHEGVRDVVYSNTKPNVMDYRRLLDEDAIITLHGWMRIIPGSICKSHDIYNLHPGLITKYPELKGADPQKKVFDMHNPPSHVGCVIHRASDEVDSGEILMESSMNNSYYSEKRLTEALHEMAGYMWVSFLEDKLEC
jgi:methionyl-tRNA formyltransferase